MELRVETNPSDDKLREHLLTDDELLACEQAHPGQVRVMEVRRYSARLQVGTHVLAYTLRKFDNDFRTFTVDLGKLWTDQIPAELHKLCYHRAAEAMLALRRGHMEYRRNRKLKADAV